MTTSNLDLDCRIATLLGWTECRVMTHDGGKHGTSFPYAVGRDPKRPYLGDKADIPEFSTRIDEVIAVVLEHEDWSISIFAGGVQLTVDRQEQEAVTTRDGNYPRAAAEALAGMIEQEKK